MNINSYLKRIFRYKWALILIPVACVIITYFLVQNLPKEYSSEVQISTGLLDPSKKIISDENVDFFKVSQQFSNIIERMKMKKIINLLSYNLILHDLERPSHAFRNYSEKIDSLNNSDKLEVVKLIRQKLQDKSILTPVDNKGRYKLYDIVGSMGYDEESLRKNLEITHADLSDFINIGFVSEDPELSAYVVNTMASVFIADYSTGVNMNQNNSIALLDSLLKKKEAVMNEKNAALSAFKRTKGVLNLGEQSATVYGQISQYEAQRAQALKEIQANQGAISIIEGKIRGNDPYVRGSNRSDNRDIIRLKGQLEAANARWIDGGFKAKDQKTIDSITQILNARGISNADENVLDPRASKQSLVQQKISLEVAMQQAKSSIKSLDRELSTLRARYASMVPFDADIQNYERDADLATKDYMAALDRYNNTRTEQNIGLKLTIDQVGLPGLPEPSKKIIYLALAGILSFLVVLSVVLVSAVLDSSLNSSEQLTLATDFPVLGTLNYLNKSERSIREIWKHEDHNSYGIYKDSIRSLRFEIAKRMINDSQNILGVTSLRPQEGKTYFAYNLAYAFARIGNKVLLIGEEPKASNESNTAELVKSQNFQSFLIKKEIVAEDLITILNKNGADTSILEIQNEKSIKAGFDVLKKQFDFIIIDINSMSDTNIAKEWLSFTEKNVAIFEAGKTIDNIEKSHIKYLKDQGGFMGWILNKVQLAEESKALKSS